eukprot:CAMPEP_0172580676 /NCGR_PEP_ID=MMETSP1067-20121228/139880_1 /TAXON_ID=265564 ORGANISM="Thalassiosira punctigera, Strain Tpunct2005C2" /NCGR_SAMPLE_ID=MMETSP1067 /ASSEMBLY_ACC=CAM_ASM_000444 /LENGTH=79 /DNA_ID=CAMNT_0013373423 /DNA_START=653 /DNA_END=892 /DNA_ORIENTATION=-
MTKRFLNPVGGPWKCGRRKRSRRSQISPLNDVRRPLLNEDVNLVDHHRPKNARRRCVEHDREGVGVVDEEVRRHENEER